MIQLLLVLALDLPNPTLTPGVTRPLTLLQVCTTRWGLDHRYVTERMKREVAARYGLKRSAIKARGKGPCCEFDHLIPRELAGDDAVLNLWPQPWVGPNNAGMKDREENRLHRAVCAGTIELKDAQQRMQRWPKP